MKVYILKSLLEARQKRIMLVIELFVSYMAFYFILSFIAKELNNTRYPLGFDYENLYSMEWDITARADDGDTVKENMKNIAQYIQSYPGVTGFGKCQSSFFFAKGYMNPHQPLKGNDIAVPADQVNQMLAGDELAGVLDLTILEGRWFGPQDNASRNRPVVLTQNLKKRMFGNENALGEIIDYCGQQCIIVGICNNIKHKGDYARPENTLFIRDADVTDLPYETWICMSGSNCGRNFFIKGSPDLPESFESDLTHKIALNYPGYNIIISPMKTIRGKYIRSTLGPLIAILLVVAALFLNVLFGLFGVLWYNISQRRAEIGLRRAVGANRRQIYLQFMEEMLLLATVGIIPGIIMAVQIPLFDLFQMETRVYISAMILAALIIYFLVALCAMLPSTRAAGIQPAIALHEE